MGMPKRCCAGDRPAYQSQFNAWKNGIEKGETPAIRVTVFRDAAREIRQISAVKMWTTRQIRTARENAERLIFPVAVFRFE